MLRTLMKEEYHYLRRVAPHSVAHYWLLGYAVMLGIIPLSQIEYFIDRNTMPNILMLLILPIYWLIQFSMIHSGVLLGQYRTPYSDKLLGVVSQRTLLQAKVWAVLQHHRYFIGFITIAMIGLTTVVTLFLYYWGSARTESWEYGRGIWQYIGIVNELFIVQWQADGWARFFSPASLFMFVISTPHTLLLLTVTNSILNISIGLWARNFKRALMLRMVLFGIALIIFMGLYLLRETPAWTCIPTQNCGTVQIRLVDSLQEWCLAFVDGGVAIITGLVNLQHYYPIHLWFISPFQIRHFAILIVTLTSQLALSGFLLRRHSRAKGKKEAGSN